MYVSQEWLIGVFEKISYLEIKKRKQMFEKLGLQALSKYTYPRFKTAFMSVKKRAGLAGRSDSGDHVRALISRVYSCTMYLKLLFSSYLSSYLIEVMVSLRR